MENTQNLKFPKNFKFGTATASYQIEGAYKTDGKGLNIWDNFVKQPNRILHNHNGNISCDHYHRFKEDIALMKKMGLKHYRFSISWSRILPLGTIKTINQKGVEFYNQLINGLLQAGIEPLATLYHWDLPLNLEKTYGGWLNEGIVEDFRNYADLCFGLFGDRVKHWVTINEPLVVNLFGYKLGLHAPGRSSDRKISEFGNSVVEPFQVAHHLILSHVHAVQVYREKYQRKQKGEIGIVLNGDWSEPFDESSKLDKQAAERRMIYEFGWYADPIFLGDYSELFKTKFAKILPKFSSKEKKLLLAYKPDFFGFNHYTSRYVQHRVGDEVKTIEDLEDHEGILDLKVTTKNSKGKTIGKLFTPDWLYVVPWGIRKALSWIYQRYGKPVIYITENGCGDAKEKSSLKDLHRIQYFNDYLRNVYNSIKEDAVNVQGYYAWSFCDNFEWSDGYTVRFGLHFIDYQNGCKRLKKSSVEWWEKFLKNQLQ